MPEIQFKLSNFNSLSPLEIFHIFKLRVDVFVVEQKCYYPEIDDWDIHNDTLHLMLLDDINLVGYARLLPPAENNNDCAIGRVIIAEKYRGKDYGEQLMKQAIVETSKRWPTSNIKISAQCHLQKFYGRLGFRAISEAYLEDGIPHIDMLLEKI